MHLYTIGDLHLSQSLSKPMDIFGSNWENHADKIIKGFSSVSPDDVTVICGDISWGMGLEECLEDFKFIDSLPGRKLILKGNHDYWWTTMSKTMEFLHSAGIYSIDVINNNSYSFGDFSLCGTRGWFLEEETGTPQDRKIMNREVIRLKASLDSAKSENRIVFMHYPPIFGNYRCNEIIELFKEYNVRQCFYGHIHGKSIPKAFNGWTGGTQYTLVSADAVNFEPICVL